MAEKGNRRNTVLRQPTIAKPPKPDETLKLRRLDMSSLDGTIGYVQPGRAKGPMVSVLAMSDLTKTSVQRSLERYWCEMVERCRVLGMEIPGDWWRSLISLHDAGLMHVVKTPAVVEVPGEPPEPEDDDEEELPTSEYSANITFPSKPTAGKSNGHVKNEKIG